MHKILILTSGSVSKLDAFKNKGVTLGSFSDINYDSGTSVIKFKDIDLKNYEKIYFRMVGKSLEIATLVADYAIKNNIKIVDRLYTKTNLMPISLGKSLEMYKLSEKGIKIPKTVFPAGSKASGDLIFPYIVKSTSGQKSREVWKVDNQEELKVLQSKISKDKLYFAQELIPNARRIRVLVVGDNVIGAIVRQTKWNKDETKETLMPVSKEVVKLATSAAKAVNLDISGIDILVNSKTNEMYVIEANAAPAWKLINKYCGVVVEDEIIKYIQTKI